MKDTGGASLEGLSILILEDEAIILMDLAQIFEARGARVRPALSVESALDKLDEAAPDCALLDVNLGGGATCQEVATRLREAGVPFVLHSGDLDRHGELITELGAPIIGKPASERALVDGVLAAMRDRG